MTKRPTAMVASRRASSSPSSRPPPKSSSERGRTFRARERQREAALRVYVKRLQEQTLSLQVSRLLYLEGLTRRGRRRTSESHHVRLIRELFTVCQDGLEGDASTAHRAHQIQFKESYLRYAYDPDAIVADRHGVEAAIHQWRLYTVLHDRFHVAVGLIDAVGDDECPTFRLHAKLTVRLSRATFAHLFPHVLVNEALVQKFLHRLVEYDCVVSLRFTDDDRIGYYGLSVDFIDGLLRAGGTISEVAELLAHARITPQCTFREPGPA
jgi:hypothetical protein